MTENELRLRLEAAGDVASQTVPEDWCEPALLSVKPESPGQVAAAVRIAEEERFAIVPAGGLNQLYTGYPPSRPSVLVCSQRMNRILDYQPDDLTITCEGGVTLNQVDELLAPHGQMLALDAPLPAASTVGGLVASNTPGLRRHAYGTPRDLVIGVRAVLTGGVQVRGGGKVVKNVAGYDVCKLFTGSWGSLGIITEVTFKLRPRPRARCVLAWSCPDTETAARIGFELHQARLAPAMILVSLDKDCGSTLYAGFEGTAERVAWQAAEFTRRVGAAGNRSDPGELSVQEEAGLRDWPALRNAPLAGRIACLPSELSRALSVLGRIPSAEILADCAAGTLHFACSESADEHLTKAYSDVPASARCVWTRLPAGLGLLSSRPRWPLIPEELVLQHRLKCIIDPLETFSPGRFPGP